MALKHLNLLLLAVIAFSGSFAQNGDDLQIPVENDNQFPPDNPYEDFTSQTETTTAPQNVGNVTPAIEESECPIQCICNIDSASDDYVIDCSGNGLTEFPTNFNKKATVLHIQNNMLTEIPKDISALKNLKILNADDNEIANLALGSVSELPELVSLKLKNNRLIEFPADLNNSNGLKKLEDIDLGNNDIRTVLTSDTFSKFESLRTITLPSVKPELQRNLCNVISNLQKVLCTGSCEDYDCQGEILNDEDLPVLPQTVPFLEDDKNLDQNALDTEESVLTTIRTNIENIHLEDTVITANQDIYSPEESVSTERNVNQIISSPEEIINIDPIINTEEAESNTDQNTEINYTLALSTNVDDITKSEDSVILPQSNNVESVITTEENVTPAQSTNIDSIITLEEIVTPVESTNVDNITDPDDSIILAQSPNGDSTITAEERVTTAQRTNFDSLIIPAESVTPIQSTNVDVIITNEEGVTSAQGTDVDSIISNEEGVTPAQGTDVDSTIISVESALLAPNADDDSIITIEEGVTPAQGTDNDSIIISVESAPPAQNVGVYSIKTNEEGVTLAQGTDVDSIIIPVEGATPAPNTDVVSIITNEEGVTPAQGTDDDSIIIPVESASSAPNADVDSIITNEESITLAQGTDVDSIITNEEGVTSAQGTDFDSTIIPVESALPAPNTDVDSIITNEESVTLAQGTDVDSIITNDEGVTSAQGTDVDSTIIPVESALPVSNADVDNILTNEESVTPALGTDVHSILTNVESVTPIQSTNVESNPEEQVTSLESIKEKGLQKTPNAKTDNNNDENVVYSNSDMAFRSAISNEPADVVPHKAMLDIPLDNTNNTDAVIKVGATTSDTKTGGVDKSIIGLVVVGMVAVVAIITIKKNWSSIRKRFGSRANSRSPGGIANGTTPEEVPLQDNKSPV